MKPLALYVTAQDIKAGKRKSCEACPMALAASRKLRRKAHVGHYSVTAHRIVGPSDCWLLNAVATKFVKDFDAGRPVNPMRVLLDVVE